MPFTLVRSSAKKESTILVTIHYQSYNYLCVFLLSHFTKKVMIVPAAAAASSSKQRTPAHVADSGSDTNKTADLEESNSDSCDMEDEPESGSNRRRSRPIKVLIATWKSLGPPVAKESVLGKWYAVVYSTKRTGQLFVSKIMKRFLVDENGAVDCLNVLCLKQKVESSTLLDILHVHSIAFTGHMSV